MPLLKRKFGTTRTSWSVIETEDGWIMSGQDSARTSTEMAALALVLCTCDSFSGAGSVTPSFLASPLERHRDEKMESNIDADARAVSKEDESETEVKESSAPLRLCTQCAACNTAHMCADARHAAVFVLRLLTVCFRLSSHGIWCLHRVAPSSCFCRFSLRRRRGCSADVQVWELAVHPR